MNVTQEWRVLFPFFAVLAARNAEHRVALDDLVSALEHEFHAAEVSEGVHRPLMFSSSGVVAERHISTPWRDPDGLRRANVDNLIN